MTANEKNQKVQELESTGKTLVDKAEALLQNVVLRNARLRQELKQTKTELEEKLAQKNR